MSGNDEEGFVDYTTATAWESFSAEVEERLRFWQSEEAKEAHTKTAVDGDGVVVSVLQTTLLQFRPEKYSLALHYPHPGHYLTHWLKLEEGEPFALLYPNSFSGCILDKEESAALLSALSSSISSCTFPHAVLIPEKDRQRRAFVGVQLRPGGHLAKLSTDCITGSLVASKMHSLYTLDDFFMESVLSVLSPWKAERVRRASVVSMTRDFNMTWTLPESDSEMCIWINDWNAECPWYPWAEYEDPIVSIKVSVGWDELPSSKVQTDVDNFQSVGQISNAFTVSSLLRLEALNGVALSIELNDDILSEVMWQTNALEKTKRQSSAGGYFFAQMIAAYHDNFELVENVRGVSELALDSFWDSYDYVPQIPADKLLNSQMAAIFNREIGCVQNMGVVGNEVSLPSDNILGYLAMYALSYGDNSRAISLLWKRFISELRLCYWEERELIPRMSTHVVIDHSCHLIEQKVQLIHSCILVLRNSETLVKGSLSVNRDDSNPALLTSDQISEFDYMFTITSNKKSKIDVWMKMHGRIVTAMLASFLRENEDSSFGDFKKYFQSCPYFIKFSKLCKSLGWNNFTKERLKDVWNSITKGHERLEAEDVCAVLCSKVEMALDWLEHVSPLELFNSLYCIGVSQAVRTLSASRNLVLKPASDLLYAVKDSIDDWLSNASRGLSAADVKTNHSASTICLDLHLLEVVLSFAESVMQKFVFLSLEAKSLLLDSFIKNLATKDFSVSPFLHLNVTSLETKEAAEEEDSGIMLLHLRKQIIQLYSKPDATEGKKKEESKEHEQDKSPQFYTYLCQDMDSSLTRFASITTV